MIWCWQQDPEMRPTATQVVEAAKSEQFCRLVDGIHIDDNARVLCACKREIVATVRHKSRNSKMRERSSTCLEMSRSYQELKEPSNSLEASETITEKPPSPPRSISEGQFVYESSLTGIDSISSVTESTIQRKLDVVHKYELWVSSSDVHSSRITIIDYCGKFTGIKVHMKP